jgi:hypothetical protein
MSSFHKTLIVAHASQSAETGEWTVKELAMASEHAPFRHANSKDRVRSVMQEAGQQLKKQKTK